LLNSSWGQKQGAVSATAAALTRLPLLLPLRWLAPLVSPYLFVLQIQHLLLQRSLRHFYLL